MQLAALWNVLEAEGPLPLFYAAALLVASAVVALLVASAARSVGGG